MTRHVKQTLKTMTSTRKEKVIPSEYSECGIAKKASFKILRILEKVSVFIK